MFRSLVAMGLTAALLPLNAMAQHRLPRLPTSQMVGGSYSAIWQGPYAFIEVEINEEEGYSCSGVLIGPREVLTAAHCVISDPGEAQAVTGNFQVAVGGQVFGVSEMYYHPQYDPAASVDDSGPYDLGMLILSAPVTTVAPVPVLYNNPVTRSESVKVFGFGANERDQPSSISSGKSAKLRIVDLEPGSLIAQYSSSGAITCAGDSGGGVVQEFGSYKGVVGTVSAGTSELDGDVCYVDDDAYAFFVDLQTASSQAFLANFTEVQYLSGAFAEFKAAIDSSISEAKKLQRQRSLGTASRSLTTIDQALSKVARYADTKRAGLLQTSRQLVKTAKRQRRLADLKKTLGTLLSNLSALAGFGVY